MMPFHRISSPPELLQHKVEHGITEAGLVMQNAVATFLLLLNPSCTMIGKSPRSCGLTSHLFFNRRDDGLIYTDQSLLAECINNLTPTPRRVSSWRDASGPYLAVVYRSPCSLKDVLLLDTVKPIAEGP